MDNQKINRYESERNRERLRELKIRLVGISLHEADAIDHLLKTIRRLEDRKTSQIR